jgi:aspartate racemase
MGPRATVQFEQTLLNLLPGTDQAIPPIFCSNDGRIPDRSDYLLGKGPDPVPQMARNLALLESAGATIVCVPCNTACAPAILGRLQAKTKVPIIDLPNEVVRVATRLQLRRVIVLATAGTVQARVYQRVCRQQGIQCMAPSDTTQQLVNQAIAAVKRGQMAMARALAHRVQLAVSDLDADGVILGCTELPCLATQLVPEGLTAIDTLQVLAQSCIATLTSKEKINDTRRVYA